MLSSMWGRFLQHTRPGSLLPTLLLVFSISIFVGCGGGSSDSANTGDSGATASAPTFSVTVGDGQMTINETGGTGRTNALTDGCTYNVYIASVSGVTADNYGSLADGARYEAVSFPYTITGLDNGKTYYVIVTEVCEGAETTVMNETSATPTDGTVTAAGDDISGMTPESIDVTDVTAGVEEVEVIWSASSNFATLTSADFATEAYRVCWEEGANPDSSSPCDDVGRGENSYTATGLTGGTEYCFGVKQRKDVIGDSDFGAVMCATPISGAPTGVTATAGDTQVTVAWAGSAGATSYNVYYSATSGVNKGNGTKVTGATSGGAVTGLTNGTTYYFVVTAVNAVGESAESSEASATLDFCAGNMGDPLLAGFFPDANLQTCINGKGWTNASNATGGLDCSFRSISDLTGMQCLTGLTTLYLYNNSIVDVSGLSTLTNLTLLWLHNNSIVDVSGLSTLTNLTQLYLYQNSIGGQNVGKVNALTTLTSITNANWLNLSNNNGMSCAELTTLQTALNTGGNTPVKPATAVHLTDCTNP